VRNERILGVIPARLGSERLPRKPLHSIAGRPLLEWVWRRISSMQLFDAVVVATDAEEIVSACALWGAPAVLTDASHDSGTARIAEVLTRPEYAAFDIIVNVQGDEPFIEEAHVRTAVAQVEQGFDIGTVATPVCTMEAWRDPGVVKVVRGHDGGALYFSRSAIPHLRGGEPTEDMLAAEPYLRHVGVYAYRAAVLRSWSTLPASSLEAIEKLEQLRALTAGLSVGVGIVNAAHAGVDTAADAERAAERLSADI
jgi:3-deoxy-manno-octulosonate cytidylyltransferase (CMP-KDO synthetase)